MSQKWLAPMVIIAAFSGWLLAFALPDVGWLKATTLLMQTTFLAALKMIVAPLIFFSLLSGVMQLRAAGSLGRLGGLTLGYYTTTSAIAVVLGLIIVFFIHPWTDYPALTSVPPTDAVLIDTKDAGFAGTLANLLSSMFANPFGALAEMNILGILTSALLLGIAATLVLPENSSLPRLVNDITQIIYKIAGWIITTLPLGLFAIAFQLTGKVDVNTLISLGHFAFVVICATLFHGLIVLPAIAWAAGGVRPGTLFPSIIKPMLTAFVTSSSAATLPVSMQTLQEELHVSKAKAAFILPLGATVNMDGTALFEAIAVIFLAYMFAIPLDAFSIVVIFLVTMLASAGAPGIPSGSMAGLQTVLLAVGIPLEAIGLVLLIERPLDTIRTAINVEGDIIGGLVVERWT